MLKKMFIFFLILGFCPFLFIVEAQEIEKPDDSQSTQVQPMDLGLFRITPVSGFQEDSDNSKKTETFSRTWLEKKGNYNAFCIIEAEVLGEKDYKLTEVQQLKDKITERKKAQIQKFKTLKTSDKKLGNLKFKRMEWSGIDKNQKIKGLFLVARKNKVHSIIFTIMESEELSESTFSAWEEQIEKTFMFNLEESPLDNKVFSISFPNTYEVNTGDSFVKENHARASVYKTKNDKARISIEIHKDATAVVEGQEDFLLNDCLAVELNGMTDEKKQNVTIKKMGEYEFRKILWDGKMGRDKYKGAVYCYQKEQLSIVVAVSDKAASAGSTITECERLLTNSLKVNP